MQDYSVRWQMKELCNLEQPLGNHWVVQKQKNLKKEITGLGTS